MMPPHPPARILTPAKKHGKHTIPHPTPWPPLPITNPSSELTIILLTNKKHYVKIATSRKLRRLQPKNTSQKNTDHPHIPTTPRPYPIKPTLANESRQRLSPKRPKKRNPAEKEEATKARL
jgi:hypothetical protein